MHWASPHHTLSVRSPTLLFLLCLSGAWPGGSADPAPPLTRCLEVHRLPRADAATGLAVKIAGVISFASEGVIGGFLLHDGTRAVYVSRDQLANAPPREFDPRIPLRQGLTVELEGRTDSGNFAPLIRVEKLRVTGTGPVPPGAPVPLADLYSGAFDCQRVRVQGVVQKAEARPGFDSQLRFSLAAATGRCEVFVLDARQLDGAALLDAEVEIEGSCFTFFNARGELAGVRLQLTGPAEIRVVRPGLRDPFAAPAVTAEALRPFSLDGPPLHRRQLRGTVTLCRPGEFLYVQAGERGVLVQTRQKDFFAPGEEVAVAGFIDAQQQFASVREAVVRRLGAGTSPIPRPVQRQEVLGVFDGYVTRSALDVHGRLVAVTGRILEVESLPTARRLHFESDGAVLTAQLGAGEPARPAHWRPGSEVRVTGVCVSELSSTWPAQDYPRVTGFHLLLRTPEDVAVLRAAPWWTTERLWKALAGVFAVLILALGWALVLRRSVERERERLAKERRAREEQERAREAAQVEFEATMRERERLAADLHDTLEQALTGVAFQLETMNRLREHPPERSVRHLSFARQMLARSREDVRRSVWNLRANALDGRMLREALHFIAEGLTEGQGITITSGGSGEEEALPDLIAGNLLMLAKEGITNALKHAVATTIHLAVDYTPEAVTLTVEDNGRGFTPEEAAGPQQGHFGLQGMRERARRLGAEFRIDSAPGRGTRVAIRVPLGARTATPAENGAPSPPR